MDNVGAFRQATLRRPALQIPLGWRKTLSFRLMENFTA